MSTRKRIDLSGLLDHGLTQGAKDYLVSCPTFDDYTVVGGDSVEHALAQILPYWMEGRDGTEISVIVYPAGHTSFAHKLQALPRQFYAIWTGTELVVEEEEYTLIDWLEQVVAPEVQS